ncbi:MAG: hypothetical protein ORN57_04785, partial [Alphaproteobacteria bacterium]|nr:hypothetical protein [Alphaproteobacteria bacterium]
IPAVGLGFDVMGWKNNQYATSYSGVAAVMIPKLALQYDLPVGRGTVSFGTYLKYYLPFHNVKMTNSDDANIYGNYKLGAALAWGFSVGGSF